MKSLGSRASFRVTSNRRTIEPSKASPSLLLAWGLATLFSLAWAVLVVSAAGLPF